MLQLDRVDLALAIRSLTEIAEAREQLRGLTCEWYLPDAAQVPGMLASIGRLSRLRTLTLEHIVPSEIGLAGLKSAFADAAVLPALEEIALYHDDDEFRWTRFGARDDPTYRPPHASASHSVADASMFS